MRRPLPRSVSFIVTKCEIMSDLTQGAHSARIRTMSIAFHLHYKTIPCSGMTDAEIEACSRLFSSHYGTWAQSAEENKRGTPVRLSPSRMRKMFVEKPNRHVSMMFDGERLVGQVFYIRCPSPWTATRHMTFVQQLVLDGEYRGSRLGLKMLQAVLGLSNDDAWGLYTSNPLTVRALEDATFRKISVNAIRERLPKIRSALQDIFETLDWLDSFRNGCIDTHFNVSHENNPDKIKKAYPDGSFPFKETLRDGEEYLAVTFRSQQVNPEAASIRLLTETSLELLNDAYSKMSMESQRWASFAREEVDVLFSNGWVAAGDKVLDLGCGFGRHSIELANRGCLVRGIDFSDRLIHEARRRAPANDNPTFDTMDILSFEPDIKYDAVLCLYDVLGSSTDSSVNAAIARIIEKSLKRGGVAVVSAMNLEMTRNCCRRSDNTFHDIHTKEDFRKLIKLPPSRTMQTTGEIFKGQLLLLNPETGIVYRKEQFVDKEDLPREYVIADKRYTGEELVNLFKGLSVQEIRYVRAGHWNERLRPVDSHAKEVFGVFRKKNLVLRGLLNPFTCIRDAVVRIRKWRLHPSH